MKALQWDEEKSRWLRAQRGVGFEDVVVAISEGKVLDDLVHPDPARSHQRVLVVEIDGYAYLVPYVEEKAYLFLKTVYPSRRLTRRYLREASDEEAR